MTEQKIKAIYKIAVDNINQPLTDFEKELLKQAIDKARSHSEIALAFLAILSTK